MTMRWLPVLILVICCLAPRVAAADVSADSKEPAGILAPDGSQFGWWDWLQDEGPAAVLVWSSWAPRSELALRSYDELRTACAERGLSLIIVDVQEPIVEARKALGLHEVEWVHDRYGALLKRHRVFRVPSLLILERDGKVLAILEPRPDAVRQWSGPK